MPLDLKLIACLSIKYNERNRNVYLGKVCAQMYTMKMRGNEPTFSKNERKCAATPQIPYLVFVCGLRKNISHKR